MRRGDPDLPAWVHEDEPGRWDALAWTNLGLTGAVALIFLLCLFRGLSALPGGGQ